MHIGQTCLSSHSALLLHLLKLYWQMSSNCHLCLSFWQYWWDYWVYYLRLVQLSKFLLVFAVVCVLALVAAQELPDLRPVLALELLQGDLLLLLKLVLRLAERAQLLLEGAPHLLHLPRHGDHTLRVLPRYTGTKRTVSMGSRACHIMGERFERPWGLVMTGRPWGIEPTGNRFRCAWKGSKHSYLVPKEQE